MTDISLRGLASGALLATALALQTTRTTAQEPHRFEITPFAAYRVGGDFVSEEGDARIDLNDSDAQGIIFNIKANDSGQYELLYSRQTTDASLGGLQIDDETFGLQVDTFHFGGTYLFAGEDTRPFLAFTLGLTRFDPRFTDSSSENFYSASLGGGVQLNSTKSFGVRLEARVFTTFVENDSNIFCSSSPGGGGTCLIQVDARTLSQWEARAGLVFRF
jgi:hypothetical protein